MGDPIFLNNLASSPLQRQNYFWYKTSQLQRENYFWHSRSKYGEKIVKLYLEIFEFKVFV